VCENQIALRLKRGLDEGKQKPIVERIIVESLFLREKVVKRTLLARQSMCSPYWNADDDLCLTTNPLFCLVLLIVSSRNLWMLFPSTKNLAEMKHIIWN